MVVRVLTLRSMQGGGATGSAADGGPTAPAQRPKAAPRLRRRGLQKCRPPNGASNVGSTGRATRKGCYQLDSNNYYYDYYYKGKVVVVAIYLIPQSGHRGMNLATKSVSRMVITPTTTATATPTITPPTVLLQVEAQHMQTNPHTHTLECELANKHGPHHACKHTHTNKPTHTNTHIARKRMQHGCALARPT